MDAVLRPFRKGMILLWSGSIASIPRGWALCDGTNETPNLENSFIVGAGDAYVVAATGGSVNHVHNFTGEGHSHDLAAGTDIAAGSDYDNSVGPVSAYGTTDAENGLPPYYALAYIMKL